MPTSPLHRNGSSVVACVYVAAGMCLPSRCIAVDVCSDSTLLVFRCHVTILSKLFRSSVLKKQWQCVSLKRWHTATRLRDTLTRNTTIWSYPDRAGCPSGNDWLVSEMCSVRILACTSDIRTEGFRSVSQSIQTNAGGGSLLRHGHFLPDPFEFIDHQSQSQPLLYSLLGDKR
jgi:hypothetical protein